MKSFSTIPILIVLLITSIFTLSFAQVDWTKSGDPVLKKGVSGSWDDGSVVNPCAIFEDTLYKMWYMGYDGAVWRIGYATSEDGLNWTKHVANPVLNVGDSGSWDDVDVFNPYVIFKDSVYQMWYSGDDGSTTRIGYATSMDGISWTKYEGNPVFDIGPAGSWNERSVSQPCVRFDLGSYHMWFGGWGNALRSSIGYATSTDGITWTEYASNPVLVAETEDSWDDVQVSVPEVIFDGNTYHMWYNGQNTPEWFHWRLGYALSQDGINWTKHVANPVLNLGESGSWDDQSASYPGVILNEADSFFEMYYTGGAADWDGQIGHATATVTALFDIEDILVPGEYLLHQNYPNPFNPSTTIEFTLPKSEFVELKIYNVLGKEVVILVSEKLNAGNYTYTWDAGSLASGVYYYRLSTNSGFVQTKKLVLIK